MIYRPYAIGFAFLLVCSVSTRAHADNQVCNDSYEQGQILRKDHKLLEARDQFRACVNTCTLDAKKKACSEWLTGLDRDIPTVVLSAKDRAGAPIVHATVTMDGKTFAITLNGRSIEVNPDSHVFVFEAADGTKSQTVVIVAEGQKDKPIAVTLAKPSEAAEATPQQSPATAPPKSEATPAVPSEESSPPAESANPWRTIGVVTAALGVVGLGVGTLYGLQALSKKNDAGCDASSVCPSDAAASTLQDAKGAGNLSTIFFIAGGALAASGLTMWALAPSGQVQAGAVAGNHWAGVALKGVW